MEGKGKRGRGEGERERKRERNRKRREEKRPQPVLQKREMGAESTGWKRLEVEGGVGIAYLLKGQ